MQNHDRSSNESPRVSPGRHGAQVEFAMGWSLSGAQSSTIRCPDSSVTPAGRLLCPGRRAWPAGPPRSLFLEAVWAGVTPVSLVARATRPHAPAGRSFQDAARSIQSGRTYGHAQKHGRFGLSLSPALRAGSGGGRSPGLPVTAASARVLRLTTVSEKTLLCRWKHKA